MNHLLFDLPDAVLLKYSLKGRNDSAEIDQFLLIHCDDKKKK